jgi:hypothetical protein
LVVGGPTPRHITTSPYNIREKVSILGNGTGTTIINMIRTDYDVAVGEFGIARAEQRPGTSAQ